MIQKNYDFTFEFTKKMKGYIIIFLERTWVRNNSILELFLIRLFFFSILQCSHTGDPPQEELAKIG
jgi:hypothetical protein